MYPAMLDNRGEGRCDSFIQAPPHHMRRQPEFDSENYEFNREQTLDGIFGRQNASRLSGDDTMFADPHHRPFNGAW